MQETVADAVKNGFLTEKTALAAAASLVPNFTNSVSAALERKKLLTTVKCDY